MNFKKSLGVALFVFMGTTPINADKAYLTIDLKSGESYSLLLADSPVISYNESSLLISGSTRLSFLLSEVDNYHFNDEQTSVATLRNNEVRISYVDNQNVLVEGLMPNAQVVLYSSAGTVIEQSNASAAGDVHLALPETVGVYVLKTNNVSFKLVKK